MTKKTIFIFFFLCVSLFYNTKRSARLDWDVFGYYLYLPAKFIYDDIRLEKKDQWLSPTIEKYKTTDNLYQAYKGPKDVYVMKYTMGLAYVYAPFFFIANTLAPVMGYEQDGFSPPYQWLLLICSMLFSLIGIYYLFKILSIYFSDHIVLTCIAIIVFGSNYFVMTAFDGLMPHNFVFAFFAIMLYQSIRWYEDQKLKRIFIIGICIGIAVLIRPTSIVVAIVPALWSVSTFSDLRKRGALFLKHISHLVILSGVAFLVLLPQFIYWHAVTGEWLFYSYPDEKINLLTPHIINVVFSYKKGWLLYTPIMIFALLGFIDLFKRYRPFFFPVFIFFLVNAYIISCWDCWWYGGSFAQRPFVESYVFMAFPLAAFIEKILTKKVAIKVPVFLVFIFFIYLNLFQTKQALNGVLHTTLTTKEYYWRVFMKGSASDEDRRWLEPSQYPDGKDETDPAKTYRTVHEANLFLEEQSSQLNAGNLFSKSIPTPTDLQYADSDHFLIAEIVADTASAKLPSDLVVYIVTCINKNGKVYKYRSKEFSSGKIRESGGHAQLSVLLPPQVNNKNYEIVSYAYINESGKMTLLSLRTKVIKVQNGSVMN